MFCKLSLEEQRKIEGLSGDRGDIILAGALTVLGVFERLDIDSLTISTAGLREGMFFEHFWEHLPNPVIPECAASVSSTWRGSIGHHRHS